MRFFDRLSNVLTGLATAKDKTSHNRHVHILRDRAELEAAYRDNWIAKKAIDIVPFDMLREWRGWKADEKQVEAIEGAETALDLRTKYLSAMIRGRLYGGGAILIGDGSSDPTQELIIERLPKGGIKYLHVLSRYEVTAGEVNRDPISPYYGEPTYYEVSTGNRTTQRIHPSRVVRFLGAQRPDGLLTQQDGWSDSLLQSIMDSVDQATSAAQHIAAMLPEAKAEIISIPGLSDLISTTEGEKLLTERLRVASLMRSMFNVTVVDGSAQNGGDGGDSWQQKQLSFASLPDVARLFLQVASGAADIPVTRMLGQAPAGLNATGDSDTRNFYDHIAAKQQVELTPTLRRLDRLLIRHALGSEPAGVWYAWNPLYQPSEKEKAEVGKIKAETISVLANTATVPEEVLAEGTKGWLIDAGLFAGIEAAYDAHKGPLVEEQQDDLGPDGLPIDQSQGGGPNAAIPFADAYNPLQRRDAFGRWISGIAEVLGLTSRAAGTAAVERAVFARVTRPATIRKLVGGDVRGFSHAVDSQAVRHTFKKHGNAATERARGQIAVTAADYAHLPAITSKPDRIEMGKEMGRHGEPRVEFHKEIGGERYVYIAEVRRGKKRLDMVTMWKR